MWNVGGVRCLGCEMFGMFRMFEIWDAGCRMFARNVER